MLYDDENSGLEREHNQVGLFTPLFSVCKILCHVYLVNGGK